MSIPSSAALHIACGGIAFLKSGCPTCAEVGMEQKNKTTGRITFLMDTLYAVMADGFYRQAWLLPPLF
jgi:hypothetical protein